MRKPTRFAKLILVLGSLLTIGGCGLRPQSSCQLTESDGAAILGPEAKAVDKTDDFFGRPSNADEDKNFSGCGYVAKRETGRTNLYWTQTKFNDLRAAKHFFEVANEKLPDADDYSSEKIDGIGDEAAANRFRHDEDAKMELVVRKGAVVFSLFISKPSKQGIPADDVRSIAERIARQTQ